MSKLESKTSTPQPFWSIARRPAAGGMIRPIFPFICISEQKKRNFFPRHQHPAYEIILVEHGTYVGVLNQTKLTLRAGQALVVKPGDWHEDGCIPPLHYRGLRFHVEWPGRPAPALFSPSVRPADQVIADPHKLYSGLFDRISAESRRSDATSSLILAALLEELFWNVVRALRNRAISPSFQQFREEQALGLRMENLFQIHQGEALPVGEMARALGLAERTLDRQCRELFGESPARCFARFKVARASSLLRQTTLPIKEISAALGFDNPFHFSRVYRRLEGCSPSSIRLKMPSPAKDPE